ncbi:MAG: hypothetical protein M3286_00065 [Thermoproteota archaeon]|jgi:hypothetical protein|nr:hypothetical protein [Thermoproteota archaeon]
MMEDSKYLAHFVQYLRPNAYGLGDGKHGYASLSQRFLHGDMLYNLRILCYNLASTKGGGERKNILYHVIMYNVSKIAIKWLNYSVTFLS